jgi:DNA-binding transcriptional ArsR family regulator
VDDRYAKKLFQFLFLGTRGGANRIRIVKSIIENPSNTNQLASELGLDFKAVQHHLGVLTKNNILTTMGEKYNVMYFPSTLLEENLELFEKVIPKEDKK